MKRTVMVLCTAAILVAAGVLLSASSLQVPSGTWIAVGPMNSAHSGASAVLLQDGRILVAGGNDTNGPSTTAEFFGANGSFSMATPMNVARSGHVAVVLQDGRVLVAGGTISGGASTNSAEIYDPVANSWTNVVGGMVEARAGAMSAVLQDGRVLIAGGQNGTAISSTIEIFDPSLGAFTPAGMMASPRTRHAMTVLTDGRVLIVGGNNGTAPVDSTDIFDPVAGVVSAGPSLSVARFGHSATTLLNGQVVVIGGNNGNTNATQMDVTPAEVVDFTAPTPAFTPLAINLATPREGHQAFLLPNNNNVLIVGGTSAGASIASAELFTAQESPQGVWTFGFGSTGSMATARRNATGAPNQVSTPSSVTQRNGVLLVAGGNDANGNPLNSAEAYGFPTVQTDQSDYPPGTPVTITGSGFQPGETVTIQLVESPLIDTHGPYTVQADANGNISDSSFVTDVHDIDVRLYLTAAGQTSGFQAQNTFTDSQNLTITFLGTGSGSVGGTGYNCTDAAGTATGTCILGFNNNNVITLTATASPGSTIGTWALSGVTITSGCTTGSSSCTVKMGTVAASVTLTITGHNLAITSVNGGSNPTAGTAFSVVVQSQDGSGNALNVAANTGVILSLKTGAGTLAGTLAGTITAGTSSVTISGITYTKAESGVVLTATRTSGDLFLAGNSAAFTVNAGTVNAGTSTVSASPTSVFADGSTTSTVTVTLEDANSNPVSGKTVSLTAGGGSSTVTPGNGTTNASGQASFSVKDTVVESVTYTAKDTTDTITVTQTAAVSFIAGPVTAGNSVVSASPGSVTADGSTTSTITVTLKDASNRPVSGKAVILSQGAGSSTISAASGPSNASGVVTFTVKDTKAEAVTYTATDSTDSITITQTATVTFTAGTVNAGTSTVSANPTSVVADGATTSTITVTLKDANNNPVTGKAVSLAAGSGSSTISTVSGTTNASGQASFTVKDTAVESVTYTAKDTTDSITVTQTATVSFTAGPANASASTVSANPASVTADGVTTSTITVTLIDSFSHPVSGKTVSLIAGSGSSTITTVSGTTNASGQATFTVKDTVAQAVTYTAKDTTDTVTVTQTATVTFTAGAVNAGKSTVSANPISVTADGVTTSTITVTLLDASNNPVSGKTVTLSQGAGSSTISAASGSSNASGVVTFTVKDTKAEVVTYSATDSTDSISITQAATVTFTPGVLDHFAISAISSPQIAGTPFTITTITAQDANNNTVTSFTADGNKVNLTSNGTLVGAPISTNSFTNGVLSSQSVTITNTGSFTITATSNGGSPKSGTSNSFTVNPGAPNKLAFAQQPTNTQAGSAISPAVTVQVQDQFGNLVTTNTSNVSIAISAGGALSAGSATTVAAVGGVATFSNLVPTKSGTGFTLSATDGSLSVATSNSFNVTAAPASQLVFTTTPVTVTAGVASATITVQRQDQFNNPNTTDAARTVTLSSSSTGTATFNPTSLTISVGSSSASFTYTDTAAGTPTITAASTSPTTITSAMQTETINHAALDHITISPASATITAGGSQTYAATAFDQFNNTIGDVTSSTAFTITFGSCTLNSCTSTVAGLQTVTGNYSGKTATASLQVSPGALPTCC